MQQMIAEIAVHAKATEAAQQAHWLPVAQQSKTQPISGQLLLQRIIAGKTFRSSRVDLPLR